MLSRNGMVLAEAEKLLYRDLLGGDGERAADTPPMAQFLRRPGPSRAAFLRRTRAHPELHRTGNDHQRLPLAIDVPTSFVLACLLLQLMLDSLEPLQLLLLVLGPGLVGFLEPGSLR